MLRQRKSSTSTSQVNMLTNDALRYKTCSVAGAAAYMVCRNTGHPIAGNVAAGGAVVAAGAEAAVKWSQSPLGQAAGRKVAAGACAAGKACSSAGKKVGSAASSAASSAGQHAASGAKAAACAVGKVCNAAGKAIGDAASKAAKGASSFKHTITGGGHSEPDLEMGHHHRRRAQDEYEYSPVATREPEPEPELEGAYERA
jgi:hypothetical protein